MRLKELVLFLIGGVLVLWGFVMTAGGFGTVFSPKEGASVITNLLMTLFVGVLPLVGGVWLCMKQRGKGKERGIENRERKVLELAKSHKGELTVADVSMGLKLSSAQAKAALERCHQNSLADPEVTDNGVVVYRFRMLDRG